MEDKKQELEIFFDKYAERFNKVLNGEKADIEETANCFTGNFIESSPAGVLCGENGEGFKKKIPEGYSFYKSIGIISMDILFKEITPLDDLHTMVKVHWRSAYVNKNKSSGGIEFDVIYLLTNFEEQFKIFAYMTGDEQKALKDHGLL